MQNPVISWYIVIMTSGFEIGIVIIEDIMLTLDLIITEQMSLDLRYR